MKHIGLHLHIDDTLVSLAQKAIRLNLEFFQCFLALRTEGRLISFTDEDIEQFLVLRKKHFGNLYLHSSYWVNLSDPRRTHHPLLEEEFKLAKKLQFTHVVFHAGSAKGARNKKDAIDALARTLNKLLAQEHDLQILLENTAHGGNAIGSDLRDFRALLKQIEQPEKLKFCIDLAHAYLFGYDIVTQEGRKKFMELVEDIFGWKNVHLLHLNDTQEALGSKIDQHWPTGEGTIGDEALKAFVLQPEVIDIPVLLEVPMLSEEKQKQLLEKVSGWYEKK